MGGKRTRDNIDKQFGKGLLETRCHMISRGNEAAEHDWVHAFRNERLQNFDNGL